MGACLSHASNKRNQHYNNAYNMNIPKGMHIEKPNDVALKIEID